MIFGAKLPKISHTTILYKDNLIIFWKIKAYHVVIFAARQPTTRKVSAHDSGTKLTLS